MGRPSLLSCDKNEYSLSVMLHIYFFQTKNIEEDAPLNSIPVQQQPIEIFHWRCTALVSLYPIGIPGDLFIYLFIYLFIIHSSTSSINQCNSKLDTQSKMNVIE